VTNLSRSDNTLAAAREAALQAVAQVAVESTSLVSYRSQGRLLIIGDADQALTLGAQLKTHSLHCHVLAWGEGLNQAQADLPTLFIRRAQTVQIGGHLGQFKVTLHSEANDLNVAQAIGSNSDSFDLILDLDTPAHLQWETLPLGYFAPRGDSAELDRALTELPEFTGEFEKATFFQYDADICAHGARGLKGCTRCLDSCPTGAITSLGNLVAIDPYTCQGGGSCATACPTGAIIYSFPRPADMLNRLRLLLNTYRDYGGQQPVLLFHDAEAGAERLATVAETLPDNVIPIEVEEIGSVGMDTWLAALAHGASRVLLMSTAQVAPSVQQELHEQLSIARVLLEGMGYPTTALELLTADLDSQNVLASLQTGTAMPAIKPAGFAGSNSKRDVLFYAIDWLAAQTECAQTVIPLPTQAPFGEIQVNRSACTLCMACVSVCPASALFDGGEEPKLEFLEAHCVQCGLCETACPEDAITRQTRFLFDQQQRRRRRVLHEEAAFHCVQCGKPFATSSMIEKMTAKLGGHWMFQDEQALNRLRMCGDCRVRDMFGEEIGGHQ